MGLTSPFGPILTSRRLPAPAWRRKKHSDAPAFHHLAPAFHHLNVSPHGEQPYPGQGRLRRGDRPRRVRTVTVRPGDPPADRGHPDAPIVKPDKITAKAVRDRRATADRL